MSANRNMIGLGMTLAGLIVIGSGMLGLPQLAAQPTGASARGLAESKVSAAKRALEHLDQLSLAGRVSADQLIGDRLRWNRRLLDAQVSAASDATARVGAAEEYVRQTQKLRDTAKAAYDAAASGMGFLTLSDVEYELLDAQSILGQIRER